AKVEGLCSELSRLLADQPLRAQPRSYQSQRQGHQPSSGGGTVSLFVPSTNNACSHWWPAELGTPSVTGAQNTIRYAYFPETRRLAVEIDGHITVYDTLNHQISGVSQQQGTTGATLTFTSQHGLVHVSSLPVVVIDGMVQGKTMVPPPVPPHVKWPASTQEEDVFSKIERLAELKQKGILSEEEFAAKKAELLSRL
ncbi:MAG: SHOCT domain-containing protein, partial [Nitrososphaera sp.]